MRAVGTPQDRLVRFIFGLTDSRRTQILFIPPIWSLSASPVGLDFTDNAPMAQGKMYEDVSYEL